MSKKKATSWFLTEKGRDVSFALVTGAGFGLTLAKFAPHTFGLSYYKDFVHYYVNSQPAPLSDFLVKRYEKCLDLLNLADNFRKTISPFSATGYDMFHAGSTKSRFGAIVGIPLHFTYQSLADITKENIQVNQKKVNWDSETGKKLADAIILPEKVQEFAICREILSIHNNKMLWQSSYPFISVFVAYTISQTVNRRFNLYAAPTAIRGVLYTMTGLFSVGLYFLMKDYTEVYYESKVDKDLCKLGPDFIESGVIFYEKLLQRNKALRELMGSEGEKKYSKLGNENFGLRHPRIALVHRKLFFEGELKKARGEREESK